MCCQVKKNYFASLRHLINFPLPKSTLMKKLVTLLFLFFSYFAFAGNGGPDDYGYTWKDSYESDGPDYNWIDILDYNNATEVKLLGDDNTRGPFETNFIFHYYWYDVSQFWVGSNGYLEFHEGQMASPFYLFPNSVSPNDVLSAFGNDLTFVGNGDSAQCWYWINPTHDTLIISWIHVPYFDTNPQGFSGDNTFQIILSNIDSSITYQYKSVTPTSPYSGYSSVGIENYAGFDGLQWPNQFTIQSPPNEFAIKFYFPHPPAITDFTDAAVLQNDNTSTGGIFVVNNGAPYALTARVQNYSTHTVDPFVVNGTVFDPSMNEMINEDLYTDTMEQAESANLFYSTSFEPTEAGTYQFITTSMLPDDPPNIDDNTKNLEIVVLDTTQTEMWMGYDGGETFNFAAINWVGGSGGVGVHFKPPFYPVVITKLHFWIYFFGPTDAFSARIYDDDGIQGLPYTVLDSIYVNSSQMTVNGWTDIELSDPIILNSGSFYISWDAHSTGIQLACGLSAPISHRSYELFQDVWGIFRYRDIYEPMIAATIENYSYPTGTSPVDANNLQLDVFPNPSTDVANLLYHITGSKTSSVIEITDMQGKVIQHLDLGEKSGQHQLKLDVQSLSPGIYFASLISGEEKCVRKIVVAR